MFMLCYTCMHTCIHIYIHAYTHRCMHTCIYAYNTYMHAYIEIFYCDASWGELVRIINEELLKINDWFLANKLSLNFIIIIIIILGLNARRSPMSHLFLTR